LDKALSEQDINTTEAITLLEINNESFDMYALASAANTLTRRQFGNRGEVWAQLGLSLYPCPQNCKFCFFGAEWRLNTEYIEMSVDEAVTKSVAFEKAGANGICLMTQANYPWGRYLQIAEAIRKNLSHDMPLVANIGDFGDEQAKELVSVGFRAIYHLVRLREGKDTGIDPKVRLRTIKAARDAGLLLSYCIEPIGPEHTPKEIVNEMFRAKDNGAINVAAMWRVPVPGTPMDNLGKISQWQLAKVIAVARIVMGKSIASMGVHEARPLPLRCGAMQIYAEAGPNPRDTVWDTESGIGLSVNACKNMLLEAGYEIFYGPSNTFSRSSTVKCNFGGLSDTKM